MLSLNTIVYTIKTNELDLTAAKDYIFRQSSFRQQQFEDFVNQLKSIPTTQSQELIQALIDNEANIAISDQFQSSDPTHIESLHQTRVPKSPSFTTANQLQQQMDSDSQSTITDNQLGQRNQQQDVLTPPNIITPSASQSQQQNNRRVNFLPLQHDGIPQPIRNDMPGIDALAVYYKQHFKQQYTLNHPPIKPSHLIKSTACRLKIMSII
jgi:hypothetical protein